MHARAYLAHRMDRRGRQVTSFRLGMGRIGRLHQYDAEGGRAKSLLLRARKDSTHLVLDRGSNEYPFGFGGPPLWRELAVPSLRPAQTALNLGLKVLANPKSCISTSIAFVGAFRLDSAAVSNSKPPARTESVTQTSSTTVTLTPGSSREPGHQRVMDASASRIPSRLAGAWDRTKPSPLNRFSLATPVVTPVAYDNGFPTIGCVPQRFGLLNSPAGSRRPCRAADIMRSIRPWTGADRGRCPRSCSTLYAGTTESIRDADHDQEHDARSAFSSWHGSTPTQFTSRSDRYYRLESYKNSNPARGERNRSGAWRQAHGPKRIPARCSGWLALNSLAP